MPATSTLFLKRLALVAPASLPPLCPCCQDSGRVPDPEGGPCAVLCPICVEESFASESNVLDDEGDC